MVNLEKPWRAIRKKAGLEDVRLHDLRHSFASVAVAAKQSLPIIGALFRSTGFQHEQTELVIIVTPRLVRPVPAGALKVPTDRVGPPNEANLLLNGQTDTGVPPAAATSIPK